MTHAAAMLAVGVLALVGACAEMISAATAAAETALEDCGAMDIVELNMLRPRIVACRESALFRDAARGHASDALCDEAAACGNLLPYLAYMQKRKCAERAPFDAFSATLLEICDAYPYRDIDPKSILVGKPTHSDL